MSYENNGFFTRFFGLVADWRGPGGTAVYHQHYGYGETGINLQA